VQKSTDGGGTWAFSRVGPERYSVISVLVSSDDPAKLYALSRGSSETPVCRSSDGGLTWTLLMDGLAERSNDWVYSLALVDTAQGPRLYGATDNGVFVYDDRPDAYCAADLDGDGDADDWDAAVFFGAFGKMSCVSCRADLDADDDIDGSELTRWAASGGVCGRTIDP
jgi:hypothetical protein